MPKECVIVTGMHRSGTSLIAGIIHKLGFDGGKMSKGDKRNKLGYFENTNIMLNNQKLLKHLGLEWNVPKELPKNWIKDSVCFQDDIKKIISEEFSGDRIVIKDPRICRFIPMFVKILTDLNINVKLMVCFRNPYNTAKSLEKRYKMKEDLVLSLWKIYYSELIKNSKGMDRSFVYYDNVIDDHKNSINKLSDFVLGYEAENIDRIHSFVVKDLRHNATQKNITDKAIKDMFDYMFNNKDI